MSAGRRYAVLDVFAGEVLAGNPLAVVLDAEGLDDARMAAIAREFNLSETVFVRPPAGEGARAALRIFTPARELPFAGHPTVGTAVLLALEGGGGRFVLEERVGNVVCEAEVTGPRAGRAGFALPRLPERLGDLPPPGVLAAALSLRAEDISPGPHRPGAWSAGVPFGLVPLASRDALARTRPNGPAFDAAFAGAADGHAYPYARAEDGSFDARMFAPSLGVPEDPATGGALAAFAGAIHAYEALPEGRSTVRVRQGDDMGRPSRLTLSLDVAGGRLRSARIEGEAVVVARGELYA